MYVSDADGDDFAEVCLPVDLEDDGYNMVHTHGGDAAFILAGAPSRGRRGVCVLEASMREWRRAAWGLLECTQACMHASCSGLPEPLACWPLRTMRCPAAAAANGADHAEPGSAGPQSDSPTSDAYAPAYSTPFYTLRWGRWAAAAQPRRVPTRSAPAVPP